MTVTIFNVTVFIMHMPNCVMEARPMTIVHRNCKTLIFGGHFYLMLLAVKRKSAKI